ncbi:MAG: hypothetical protein ACFFBR_11100 [Promethearchaeota archaeon]
MDRETKFAAIFGGFVFTVLMSVALLALYFTYGPLDPIQILSSVPAAIAGATGGVLGAYLSKRQRADEREALILHHSGMYAWLFLFMALPFIAVYVIHTPPPFGITSALLLYSVWIIAILLFSITALYRYRR